jgi:hypothetical protein
MEDLRNERKNFYHFLKSEGGKDLVKKYKEWCVVQSLRADEESVFFLFSPELIVLIFSHLDECSLATVSEVCKSWKMITDMHEDYLWKRLAHTFFTFCPGAAREEQATLKREKDSMESWKQFFKRSLGRQSRLDFYPSPSNGLHFPLPIQMVHTQLYVRNSTRSAVTFFRVMVTKPKDYVVKPTHGILLPRQTLKISILARQLSKEVLEQAKVCRDKFMIQTITVTLEQLLEEGAVDPRRADPAYVRKSRSCTLDLSHVIPDNFDALRYVKDNPEKVSKHIFKCHYMQASADDDAVSSYSAAS